MNRNVFFNTLYQSVTSVRFYQDVAKQPIQEGLKYFSFLILLVTLVLSVRLSLDVFQMLSHFELWARERLPDISIENGKVYADVEQPWQEEEGDFVVIIDTTGKTRAIDQIYPQGILLMQDRLLFKRNFYETRLFDLSQVERFEFTPETVRSWRRIGQWVLPPLLVVFLFVSFWIGKFSQIILFSGVSFLTCWAARRQLPYVSLVTIGLYAITPPLLLMALVGFLGVQVRFFDMIYLSIYAALLVTIVLQSPPKPDLSQDSDP